MWRMLFRQVLLAAVAMGGAGVAAQEHSAIPHSVNWFALDLYRELGRQPGNLLFSPLSISHALGMARVGARGETAAQMDRVLHLPADFARRQAALVAALAPPGLREWDEHGKPIERPAYRLESANALWGQVGFGFLEPFLDVLESVYGAPLQRIDFRDVERARSSINGWVAEHTEGRIENIVPAGKPSPDSRLVLVNALYFKANWAEAFSAAATAEASWYGGGAEERSVPLMRRVGGFGYFETAEVQVAELPYRGDACSMLIVLPRRRDGLDAIERSLTPERLARWIGGLHSRRLDLKIPRFSFTNDFDLGATLGALGMSLAFSDSGADFGGISSQQPIVIGGVLHKAFVGVDEHGTEAAAATAVLMRAGTAAPVEAPIPFVADHPFLFAIRHRATGAILFLGRLAAP